MITAKLSFEPHQNFNDVWGHRQHHQLLAMTISVIVICHHSHHHFFHNFKSKIEWIICTITPRRFVINKQSSVKNDLVKIIQVIIPFILFTLFTYVKLMLHKYFRDCFRFWRYLIFDGNIVAHKSWYLTLQKVVRYT